MLIALVLRALVQMIQRVKHSSRIVFHLIPQRAQLRTSRLKNLSMICSFLVVLLLTQAQAGKYFLAELSNKTRYIYSDQELRTSLVEQVNKKIQSSLFPFRKHSNFKFQSIQVTGFQRFHSSRFISDTKLSLCSEVLQTPFFQTCFQVVSK